MTLVFNKDGQPCLSETLLDGKVLKWTFLPDHGYALGRYEVINPPGVRNPQPYVVTTDQFKVVDQIALPYSIVLHGVRRDGSEAMRITASVHSYKVNDPTNVEGRYSLKWPKDVEVHDRRTNRYVKITQENQVLDDKRTP